MKDAAKLNDLIVDESINIELDSVDREFLIKLMKFNQSAYKSPENLPTDIAKRYGYEFLQDREDVQTGYYAIVFKKNDANEILIVHRATLMDCVDKMFEGDWSFKNLKTVPYELKTGIHDDIKLTFNTVPKQAFQAISFVNHISSLYCDHKIVQTGHSLGGYLSQVSYWACDIETHAFDCPGAYGSLKNLFPDVEPSRKNSIKYYFTYPPCGINCDGLRLYSSNESLYEIVLDKYCYGKKANPNLIGLSVEHFISISFDQHGQENIVDNLHRGCVIRNNETCWPENPLDSYKRYLSNSNEVYWHDQFESLNLPEDKRWQLFDYFKTTYLKSRESLTYSSAVLISNITTAKLIKDFKYHQYIASGGSWIFYKFKESAPASYIKKLYKEMYPQKIDHTHLAICASNQMQQDLENVDLKIGDIIANKVDFE